MRQLIAILLLSALRGRLGALVRQATPEQAPAALPTSKMPTSTFHHRHSHSTKCHACATYDHPIARAANSYAFADCQPAPANVS